MTGVHIFAWKYSSVKFSNTETTRQQNQMMSPPTLCRFFAVIPRRKTVQKCSSYLFFYIISVSISVSWYWSVNLITFTIKGLLGERFKDGNHFLRTQWRNAWQHQLDTWCFAISALAEAFLLVITVSTTAPFMLQFQWKMIQSATHSCVGLWFRAGYPQPTL